MKQDELQALAEKAGFDWGSLGFRDRLCFMNLAVLVEQKTLQDIATNCVQRGITFCTDRMSVALASPRVAIPAGLLAEEIRRHIISTGVQAEAVK